MNLVDDVNTIFELCRSESDLVLHIANIVNAVIADTTSMSTINTLQQQCASDLFGWQVDIVEIVED